MAGFRSQRGGLGMIVREMMPEDRDAVQGLLIDSEAFSQEEVRVALQLVDEGLAGGCEGDYPLLVAELEGCVCGYVCIGRTPLTRSTWHLYWICVHPRAQRCGIGRALQTRVEEFIRGRGGERIVVETSGRPDYERSRRFYERAGYRVAGRIPGYYKPGDDCVFHYKVL
jgi:ribosomal protein S18 acetylase RimI-like enzyme